LGGLGARLARLRHHHQFPGRFSQQILPDQVHILNVSFLVPTLRREYGGCAGNIAYTLQALGGQPVVMAALGNDGGGYLARLQGWNVDTSLVLQVQVDLHGAGDHHHRYRQQPDHGLPPGRHEEAHRIDLPAATART
jgi:adenosine kinase